MTILFNNDKKATELLLKLLTETDKCVDISWTFFFLLKYVKTAIEAIALWFQVAPLNCPVKKKPKNIT